MTRDPRERATLLEMSGNAALAAARYDAAEHHMQAAADAFAELHDRLSGARVTAALGMMHTSHSRPLQGIAIIEPVLDAARDLGDEPEVITLMGSLARSYLFADDYDRALELVDEVLVAAERIDDVSIITEGVLTKGTTLLYSARYREGLVLLAGGLQLAETHGFVASQLRARLNISFLQLPDDPRLARATAIVGLDQARRLGNTAWSRLLAGNAANAQFVLGDWEALLATYEQLLGDRTTYESDVAELAGLQLAIRATRVGIAAVGPEIERFDVAVSDVSGSQERTVALQIRIWLALTAGYDQELMSWPIESVEPLNGLMCHHLAGHVALWNGDVVRARAALTGMIGTGLHGRWATAVRLDLEAGIAALDGHTAVSETNMSSAISSLREMDARLTLALALMGRVRLTSDDNVADAAGLEARSILADLGARTLIDRLDRMLAARPRSRLQEASPAIAAAGDVPTRG